MMHKLTAYLLMIAVVVSFSAGCGPTYPKERLEESIVKLCKDEYHIDVKVKTAGKTVAIYMPLDNLMDFTFSLTPEATEKLNDVIMSVMRVVLSTDADYEFYCIIAHDVRIPEIQVIIIKCINDVKRVFLGDISRGEFGKRMIIDMRLNPQSQKERSIKEVFQKMGLDQKWQEQVMNEFFRSEPTALSDIGYWNGRFYIKDITLPEFLAEEIAGRIKMEFREDKELGSAFLLKSIKGTYHAGVGKPYFKIEFLAAPQALRETGAPQNDEAVLKAILKVAGEVIHGYTFGDFDYVEIVDQAGGKVLRISKEDLEKYRTRKLKFEEIAY